MKETLTIRDHLNKNLHTVLWTTSKKPSGIVLIVHGLAEHSERYNHVAGFLNSNNYHVIAYDHRGHGKTDPEQLGFIDHQDGFHLMVKNLHDVYHHVNEEYPTLPIIILGHSMGSFITQRFMQLYTVDPAAIIYSGSNGKPPATLRAGMLISSLLSKIFGKQTKSPFIDKLSFGVYNSHFKPNRTDYDWLSRDTAMVDLYFDDPFCGFICSNSFYYQLFKGIKDIHSHPNFADHNPDIPILILSGDQDPVSNMGKGIKNLERILKRSGVRDITTHLYPEGRHEMLNEINRDEVFEDLLQWINLKSK